MTSLTIAPVDLDGRVHEYPKITPVFTGSVGKKHCYAMLLPTRPVNSDARCIQPVGRQHGP